FDSEWMFGVTAGFDVVIGNPPYGLLNKRQNKAEAIVVTERQLQYYKTNPAYAAAQGGMLNIFRLFILKSIQLLSEKGVLLEIFPLAFIGDSSASELRKWMLENCGILSIDAFPERDNLKKRVFEAAKMSVCILNLTRLKNPKQSFFLRIHRDRFVDEANPKTFLTLDAIRLLDETNLTIPLLNPRDLEIL